MRDRIGRATGLVSEGQSRGRRQEDRGQGVAAITKEDDERFFTRLSQSTKDIEAHFKTAPAACALPAFSASSHIEPPTVRGPMGLVGTGGV